jgi:hypothetical protein
MFRGRVVLASAGFLALTMAACSSTATSTPVLWACPPLPHTISNVDLVGTWLAEYGAATDRLTISSDGTFVQSYLRHTDGYSFITEGRWWLESRDTSGHYLHLEGMRRCDDTDELCTQLAGGSGPRPWFDYCEGRFLSSLDEVILLVTGEVEVQGVLPSAAGIWLRHLALDSSSGSFHFTRVDK